MNIMKRIWSSFGGGSRSALLSHDERAGAKSTNPSGSLRSVVARGDAEDRDDLCLVGLGVGDVGAGAATEPAGGFVVADEDARVVLAVGVLHPDLVALLEAFALLAHRRESIRRDPCGGAAGGRSASSCASSRRGSDCAGSAPAHGGR